MATVTVAAVQESYILMDQRACMDKAITLMEQAADGGAKIVVFPRLLSLEPLPAGSSTLLAITTGQISSNSGWIPDPDNPSCKPTWPNAPSD